MQAQFLPLSRVWLDAGYNGTGKGKDWIEQTLGWTAQTIQPPRRRVWVAKEVEPTPCPAFTALPRRRGVEHTFPGSTRTAA
jgi:hypothetical protein